MRIDSMYDYLVVGAGLYGSVFACEAIKAGKSLLVIDKRAHIGGNCYTKKISGITLHKYGPHIFHTSNEKVWKYINELARFNNFVNSPLAFYKGEMFNLPFNMNTFAKMWGVTSPKEAEDIIARQIDKEGIQTPVNLEQQALKLAGRDIYEKFIKEYTEKQWGTDCKNLPPFIIKRLPVRFTYNNNYFNDKYQGIPIGGYTKIFEKLLKGADVRLGVNFFDNRAEFLACAKKVVFTGMIDEFYEFSLGRLDYRSLRFKSEILNIPNFQGNAVINYTSKDVPYTRIIEHKHFEFGTQEKTIISYEYPRKYKEGLEAFYPVNDDKNNLLYEKYYKLAQEESKVIFGGRLGEYKYFDMDRTIEEALALSEKEIAGVESAAKKRKKR